MRTFRVHVVFFVQRFSTLPLNSSPPEVPRQDRACLAHLFTFRVFSDSKLGLANIASPSELFTGGVCSIGEATMTEFVCKTCVYSAHDIGGRMMVYNTGVSSFRRDDIILLRVEAQLVVAHGVCVVRVHMLCTCVYSLCSCMHGCCIIMHIQDNFFCLELGHNWGSMHDIAADGCGTQYLMQAFARTGSHLNNFVSLYSVDLLPNC